MDVGEALLTFLAGSKDAAFNSAYRQVHLFGNLFVFVAGNMHRERYAVFFAELVDCGCDFRCAIALFGRLERALLADVEVIQIVGGVYDCG